MKKLIILFILLPVFAFSTVIEGKFEPNEKVRIFHVKDQMMQDTRLLKELIADSLGMIIYADVEIEKLSQILIYGEDSGRRLFLEPGAKYILEEDKFNDVVRINLVEEINSDLNTKISAIESESAEKGYFIANNIENYDEIMQQIDSLLIKHTNYEDEFLNDIAKYIIANVHLNLFIKEGNPDPMKMVNNYLNKWYYGESIQTNNPYFITTFAYALSTLCNLKAYQKREDVKCTPTDRDGIELLASEIQDETYSDLARFFMIFQAVIIDEEIGKKLAENYIPEIESELLSKYLENLLE